jgi:predicted permease
MLREAIARIRGALFHRRLEAEFSEEIQAHLDMLAAEFERHGLSPEAARLAARRSFGGVEQIREEHREARGLLHLERLAADLVFALRLMRRNPGFTAIAVLTLVLGIGVNATLFSAYNAVALKPLSVDDPGGVYRLERWFEKGGRGNIQYAFSYPEFVYFREHNRSFAVAVAASWPVGVFAEWPGATPDRIQGQLVSANYFQAMGIAPRVGAGWAPDADRVESAAPVIVLSFPYWQRRLSGDVAVLGRTVLLNGTAFTVVGIAPPEFTGTSQSAAVPDFWAPISMQARLAPGRDWLRNPDWPSLQILTRLRQGMTMGTARAEAAVLIRQFGAAPSFGPRLGRDRTADVTLQHVTFFDNTEDPRFLASVAGIMVAVGLVLAVACANLANMMLARGETRRHEIAVRLALGASRARVIRQLLTEAIVLSLAGGLAGLALAAWTSRVLALSAMEAIAGHFALSGNFTVDLRPDLHVLAYTLVISLITGVLFGLSPALRLTIPERLARSGRRAHLRSVLVGGQVAVSMMLMITGGLLVRGLSRSRAADPGFETRTVYRLLADFGDDTAKPAYRQRRLRERLRALPAVAGVTEGSVPLLGTWTPPIVVDGRSGRTLASYASDSYLETVGISLVGGRNLTRLESEKSAPVALISEGTARRFWPTVDPIGRRFQLDMDFNGKMSEFTVVGVVKDVRFANVTRVDPAHVYLAPVPGHLQDLLVRVREGGPAARAAIRAAVQTADAGLMPSFSLVSLEDGPVWLQKIGVRGAALATLALAGLALLLAGVGIYGVINFLVTQRTREIGIRMALGAAAGDVVRQVIIGGLRPVFVGIFLGAMGAMALSIMLHATLQFPGSMDLLYGVSFYDPWTFAGLAAFLLAIAALASAAPARRAARVDPAVALRWH